MGTVACRASASMPYDNLKRAAAGLWAELRRQMLMPVNWGAGLVGADADRIPDCRRRARADLIHLDRPGGCPSSPGPSLRGATDPMTAWRG